MLSEGQRQALDELNVLDAAGDSIEFVRRIGADPAGRHEVEVSVETGFPPSPEGITFRPRERFCIAIPQKFPWYCPSVRVPHSRWGLRSHVNFGSHLCLYLDPAAEWDPSDGMYGFMSRLIEWLQRAAIDDLDPHGAPLHPPYAPQLCVTPTVVVRDDAPVLTNAPWFGFAHIAVETPHRIDLRGWVPLDGSLPSDGANVAAVVLLDRDLPYQYPTKLGALLRELAEHGIAARRLINVVCRAAARNAPGSPLCVVLGAPMRGTRGGERIQHLAVWHVSPVGADDLRRAAVGGARGAALPISGGDLVSLIQASADRIDVGWCPIDEARPEATRPRDGDSPLRGLAGRSVAVLGCGAIGSHLAEHLVRVGVTDLALVDNDTVASGNLCRQTYDESDLAKPKAAALAERLLRMSPEVAAEALCDNAVSLLGDQAAPIWDKDVIFDATANTTVTKRLEAVRQGLPDRPWIVTILLGHRGDRGLLTVASPRCVGGSPRLVRQAKLVAADTERLKVFADEFWPDPPRADIFIPEPGCSSPTFMGSNADVTAVVGSLTRSAAAALSGEAVGSWTLLALDDPSTGESARSEQRAVPNPVVLQDAVNGYAIHLDPHVMVELQAWINDNARNRPDRETGGVLFGEVDDATRTVAVTAAVGPPPDSEASSQAFVLGTEGLDEIHDSLSAVSRGTHRTIGTWHTHPGGDPAASPTDLEAIATLSGHDDRPLRRLLLLVAGGRPPGSTWNSYLYDSRRPEKPRTWPRAVPTTVHCDNRAVGRIGLALSGGGMRAAAFHLGCLRALNDRGLLDAVRTISGVSAGALVAALWAYADIEFDEFDDTLTSLTRRGLWKPIIRSWFAPRRLAGAMATTLTAGLSSAPNALGLNGGHRPRTTSTIHALERAIRAEITDAWIGDVARENLAVVITACELRTGSAFRFGSQESGTWRRGTIKHNQVRVATAVAASAAHPLAFPAYDLTDTFVPRDGSDERMERVILTDGGVYDNLGTSVFLPGRDPAISMNVHDPYDWIISCDTGRGIFDGSKRPYWLPGRVKQAVDIIHHKTQDTSRARLFDLDSQPHTVKGYLVAHLGMPERHLPAPIPNLVPPEFVTVIKTDLSALTAHEFDLLTRRGEQIMGALIARHGPRF